MTDLRKAAEMALEVLLKYDNDHTIQHYVGIKDSIEALRQALEQEDKEQGRIREITRQFVGVKEDGSERWVETEYRTVTRREWVGLTKEEFEQAVDGLEDLEDCWIQIEAKLKEKNT